MAGDSENRLGGLHCDAIRRSQSFRKRYEQNSVDGGMRRQRFDAAFERARNGGIVEDSEPVGWRISCVAHRVGHRSPSKPRDYESLLLLRQAAAGCNFCASFSHKPYHFLVITYCDVLVTNVAIVPYNMRPRKRETETQPMLTAETPITIRRPLDAEDRFGDIATTWGEFVADNDEDTVADAAAQIAIDNVAYLGGGAAPVVWVFA